MGAGARTAAGDVGSITDVSAGLDAATEAVAESQLSVGSVGFSGTSGCAGAAMTSLPSSDGNSGAVNDPWISSKPGGEFSDTKIHRRVETRS
jgi:hypothetical protein